jgi:hypothetical protein
MNIKNKYCRLRELTQFQIDELRGLMPVSGFFDFDPDEKHIGFSPNGNSGTWVMRGSTTVMTYAEMLSLLGGKGEDKLVPHVHQKEIIAWANGEEIETMTRKGSKWHGFKTPSWNLKQQYRVKPKLTPTQLRIQEVVAELQKLHEQDAVERGIDKVMRN